MKKSFFKTVCVMLAFVILSLSIFSNLSLAESDLLCDGVDANKVMETRFLNILNHNYVYSESFNDLEDIVNNSVVALLHLRDSNDSSYISQDFVNDYLFDMYGFKVDDFSVINNQFPQREGFVYILPRGYSRYEHTGLNIKCNEDGTFTFTTKVKISSHDSADEFLKCETMFVKNDDSVFGYNIVRSDLLEDVNTI